MAASDKAVLAARIVFAVLTSVHFASAQPCAEVAATGGASILRCGETVIAAEADAVRSPLSAASSHPQALQLDFGGVAVSLQASASSFAVLTPEAVVSGRDGDWAVLTEGGRTRVRVWRGAAILRNRVDGSQSTVVADEATLDDVDPKRMEALHAALRASGAR